ncbi:UTP--glucose-1-phosphate uridylyltransferase [subsurface metagenome]
MATGSEVHKAMILAAGEGTRLRPLTLKTPKVLLPVGSDKPLIGYILSWLKNYDITEVIINLHHMGDKIKGFLGDGSRFGVKVFYSPEETILGTAGGVKRTEHFFNSTFVVVYGDVLTDFDLRDMIQFHWERKAMATLAILEVPNPLDVGIVEINRQGKIQSFVEKPPRGSETGNLGNGGVYVLERDILDYVPSEVSSDFANDIFPELIELHLPIYGYVLKPEDYLIDIGTIEKYQKANEDVRAGKVKIRYEGQGCIS